MSIALFATLILLFGPSMIPFLILQALIGAGLLETVNYIEHYGLLRARRDDGRHVRCSPRDSWNSDRLVINIFLLHLQRHSGHHANPGRWYQTLRSSDQAPELPAGDPAMIILAVASASSTRNVRSARPPTLAAGPVCRPEEQRPIPDLRRPAA